MHIVEELGKFCRGMKGSTQVRHAKGSNYNLVIKFANSITGSWPARTTLGL